MICHLAIGMYPAAIVNSLLSQGIEIIVVVIAVVVEAGGAIIATLDDMPRYARYDQTGTTRHMRYLYQDRSSVVMVDAWTRRVCQSREYRRVRKPWKRGLSPICHTSSRHITVRITTGVLPNST